MLKPETASKMRHARKPVRSQGQIDIEVLKIISNGDGELKRTHVGNKAEINYVNTVKVTDRLVEEKLIKRDSNGLYSITKHGLDVISEHELGDETVTEILLIAREIAENDNEMWDDYNRCFFCKNDIPKTHKDGCIWKRLRELFEIGE